MALIKIEGKANIQGKTKFDTGDSDVNSYIAAVEAADGQALEQGVKAAYTDFILGCKADGIWTAIKASCIMAGARTLNGALVPLVGTAPTNFNFVSADYDRKTGLQGNGTNKWLNSNRANNADPQNSNHNSVYVTDYGTAGVIKFFMDSGTATGHNQIVRLANNNSQINNRGVGAGGFTNATTIGFWGMSRSSSTSARSRYNLANSTGSTNASVVPSSTNLNLFRRGNASSYGNMRMSFYSIGEDINLASLQGRVAALMTALNTAI